MQKYWLLGLLSVLLCSACHSPNWAFNGFPDDLYASQYRIDLLYATNYVESSNYDPEKPYLAGLGIVLTGNNPYINFYLIWSGNMDEIDLEIMGRKIDLEQKYFDESARMEEFYETVVAECLSPDQLHAMIEYIASHKNIPIRVNGEDVVLTPYQFFGYHEPYPRIKAFFYPGPFIESIHEEQMPESLKILMEERRKQAKKIEG